jgi:hypothetical protein
MPIVASSVAAALALTGLPMGEVFPTRESARV